MCYLEKPEIMNPLNEESILKPEPFQEFTTTNVVYIPFDLPPYLLLKAVKKQALKKKQTPFGNLDLLQEKTVLSQCLGAPSAVLSLERLIRSGAKEIILLGFCGSLQAEYRIGDVISITKAFSEEGTSKHYFPRKKCFFPSLALKKRIENALRDSQCLFKTGSLVSTDAPYRETQSWLAINQRRKIACVDMEASAVFALASFYNIQAAALMIISDELWSGVWKKGFRDSLLKNKIKKYFLPFITSRHDRKKK